MCIERRLLRIGMLVVLAMALIACQPATTPTQSAGKASPASGAPAAAKPEGVVRVGASGSSGWGSGVVNPPLSGDAEKMLLMLIFDWLVGVNKDGTDISKDGGVANNWETSPDGLTETFYLRKGVQFHDGNGEVTAADVKFSIERNVYSPETKASYAAAFRTLLDNIEVVDPYTVKFHLKRPSVTFAYDLSPLLGTEAAITPKGYIEKDGGEAFGRHPIGSGPYKFVELVGSSHLKLEALDNHFALGVPKFKEVFIKLVPEESTRIAQLKTGELDLIDVTPDRVDELKNDFTIVERDHRDVLLGFAAQWQGGLADKRVRQAIDLAIDKETLLRTLQRGKGKVLPGFMVPSGALGAKPMSPHPYDPDKARALLKEAGQTNMELNFVTEPLWQSMTGAIAGQLEKVGFKVKIISMDFGALIAKYRLLRVTQVNPPLNTIFVQRWTHFFLPYPVYVGNFSSGGNATFAQDPALDKLISDLGDVKNLDDYAANVGKVQQYIDKEFIEVPLLQIPTLFVVNPKKVVPWAAKKIDVGLREIVSRKN